MSPEISPPSSWTNHGRCLFGVEENGGLLPANHKKHVHDGEAMLWKMKQNYGENFVKNQFSKIVCALETNFSVLWQITSVIIIFPYSSQMMEPGLPPNTIGRADISQIFSKFSR